MLGTIFGIEIFMIRQNFSFIEWTRDSTYINSSFLNVNHAGNALKITNCELAFVPSFFSL